MIRLIIFFIVLAAVSILVSWMADNPGDLTINWMGYRLHTSLAYATGVVSAAFVVLLLALQLIIYIFSTPKRVGQMRSAAKQDKALQALTQGFAAVSVADLRTAKLASRKAGRLLKNQPLAEMLAAETAQLEGNADGAKRHYEKLLENKPTKLAAVKGLLGEAVKDGDFDTALELAERAYELKPDAAGTGRNLLNLYKQMGRWDEARKFIEKNRKRLGSNKLPVTQRVNVGSEMAVVTFMCVRRAMQNGESEKAFELLHDVLRARVDFIPAVVLYAEMAAERGREARAAGFIERAWRETPHPDLAAKYFDLFEGDSPKKRLKRALRLNSINSEGAEGSKAVAKMAMKAENPALAREHIERGLAISETAALCYLMADLEAVENGENSDNAKQWSEKARNAPADPKWMCKTCGNRHEEWDITCTSCKSIDSIIWEKAGSKTDMEVLAE